MNKVTSTDPIALLYVLCSAESGGWTTAQLNHDLLAPRARFCFEAQCIFSLPCTAAQLIRAQSPPSPSPTTSNFGIAQILRFRTTSPT